MQNIKNKFDKFLSGYVGFVQQILTYIFLAFIYYVGFGLTKLLIIFFNKKILNEEGSWQKPKLSNLDIHKPY